jgi:hypothetical protein
LVVSDSLGTNSSQLVSHSCDGRKLGLPNLAGTGWKRQEGTQKTEIFRRRQASWPKTIRQVQGGFSNPHKMWVQVNVFLPLYPLMPSVQLRSTDGLWITDQGWQRGCQGRYAKC